AGCPKGGVTLDPFSGSGTVGDVATELGQPEDVLPGDIDANLGAPWIPESDIQAFAANLFKVELSSIPVAHLKKDAVWSMDPRASARQIPYPVVCDFANLKQAAVVTSTVVSIARHSNK